MKDDPLFPTAAEREAFENFDPYAEPVTAPVPADGGAATGGLGEEAREIVWNALYGEAPRWCADAAVDALQDHVGALLSQARAEGAAEARRDAITRLTGFGVDPAVIEHFRSLLP